MVENQTGHFQYTPQIATCALLNYVITTVSISAFSTKVLPFIQTHTHTYVIKRNEILHDDGGLSIQQYKMVFLLSHGIVRDGFYVGVVTREKAK